MMIEKKIQKNHDLTWLNTFRISARAEYFVIINNQAELIEAISWAKAKKMPLFFLGGGSNVLMAVKRINGLVIKISGKQHELKKNFLTAWAGTSLAELVELAKLNNLSGLEWAVGIPGHLGGAIRGNAGAYGRDIGQLTAEVTAYDLIKGRLVKLKKNQCGFAYRESVFKTNGNLAVLDAKLKLTPGKKELIGKLMDEYMSHRRKIQPNLPSAGCVFKNLRYETLARQNKSLALKLAAEGRFRGGKIGAGYLIDQLGLKGLSRGGAEVSQTHANFIVNTGEALAGDVIKLINSVKKKVKNNFKINLEEEVQYFGK